MRNNIIITCTALLLFISCAQDPCGSTKEAFLLNFEAYFDKIPDQNKNFSDAEWQAHDEAIKKYVEDCYKLYEQNLTVSEKKRFWTKTLNFYYRRYGSSIATEVLERGHPVYQELKTYISELEENPKGAFKDILNQIGGEEMKELMNEVSGDVEKWGKKLEKILGKD